MGKKQLLAAATCALAIAGAAAGGASAGEITGNGARIAGSDAAPLNGRSECAYSGLNDSYPTGADPGRTQSWGQIVRLS